MQRMILHGVPYFVDVQNRLFTWDTETDPQHIGQYNPTSDTIVYTENYFIQLNGRLQDWRSKQQPRLRKATSNGRGNASRKATANENPEDDV